MNTALARRIWQNFYGLGTSLLVAIITHNLSSKILNYHFKAEFSVAISTVKTKHVQPSH